MTPRTSIDEIQAGDEYRVVRGSRAGSLGVSGSVVVEQLEGSLAIIAVSVGKFGINVDARLELQRDGDEVAVTATGSRFETITSRARIVLETPTELRLEDLDGQLADTRLVLDGEGGATLEAEIPRVGQLTLLVESD